MHKMFSLTAENLGAVHNHVMGLAGSQTLQLYGVWFGRLQVRAAAGAARGPVRQPTLYYTTTVRKIPS